MRRPSAAFYWAFLSIAVLFSISSRAWALPDVTMLEVEGNEHVVSQHILGVVQSKIGEALDQETLKKDIEAIYGLGFFSYADAMLDSYEGGVKVTYVVTENPVIQEIDFIGNTVYSDEDLMKMVFSYPGTVFNRVFFRHDLQRIKEKFQDDGYVMMKIKDVQVERGVVKVQIVEPRVGEVVIQGNKRTKTYVIRRNINIKEGDLFNSTILNHSLNKIRGLDYFEDVSVGFEPSVNPDDIDIILTVQEKRTGRISVSIGHGSQSGWGGGIAYSDSNLGGVGNTFDVGFDLGDYEKYWVSLSNSYMDKNVFAWKIGAYSKEYEDKPYWDRSMGYDQELFKYDETRKGGYVGAGRKFKGDDKLSWFLTLDWHDSDVEFKSGSRDIFDLVTSQGGTGGTTFSATGQITRSNLDPYLPYRKGDTESLSVEQAMEFMGGDWSFTKYWFEGRGYFPIKGLDDFIDLKIKKDNPALLAARIIAGSSSGSLPWIERYDLGGATTLRGYDSGQFKGEEILLGNFEFHLPVEDSVTLVLFYDVGNTELSFSDMKDDYGLGIRFKTPLGNLRLDYATGDDESQFNFGFGDIF